MADKRTIKVCVVDAVNGMQVYEGVHMVHVKSRYYNILIMEGYSSSIGEIDGSVTITSDTMQKKYEHLRGFYLHKKDVFHLLIREGADVE